MSGCFFKINLEVLFEMKRFSRTELKIIKWRLINQEGLSVQEADKRIEELIDYDRIHNKKPKKKGIKRNKRRKLTPKI